MNKNLFETETFHDNYIYGLSFIDDRYDNHLVFNIDYIQKWDSSHEPCLFEVVPATLTFYKISDFNLSIKQKGFWMNSYLGIILKIDIENQPKSRKRYTIKIVGDNSIQFEAENVELNIVGKPIRTENQSLTTAQRLESKENKNE